MNASWEAQAGVRVREAVVLGVVGAGGRGLGIASWAGAAACAPSLHPLDERFSPALDLSERPREMGERPRGAGGLPAARVRPRARSACCDSDRGAPAAPAQRELFARLSEVAEGRRVLATNTSSIPGPLAGRPSSRERGGHAFFNPPAAHAPLDVIRSEQTGDATWSWPAMSAGLAEVILASDGPRSCHRCGPPSWPSAAVAGKDRRPEESTHLRRVAASHGPFDSWTWWGWTGLASPIFTGVFGEPRWKQPIQARMVAAGRWAGNPGAALKTRERASSPSRDPARRAGVGDGTPPPSFSPALADACASGRRAGTSARGRSAESSVDSGTSRRSACGRPRRCSPVRGPQPRRARRPGAIDPPAAAVRSASGRAHARPAPIRSLPKRPTVLRPAGFRRPWWTTRPFSHGPHRLSVIPSFFAVGKGWAPKSTCTRPTARLTHPGAFAGWKRWGSARRAGARRLWRDRAKALPHRSASLAQGHGSGCRPRAR